MKLFKIILVLILFCNSANAQTESLDAISIPPLDTIVQHALVFSPAMAQQDWLIEKTTQDVKRVKKTSLDAIKLGASYKSGTFGNNVINTIETGYSFGPYISFSLYDLTSQRNLVNVFKAENQVAINKREEVGLELTRLITQLYNNLTMQKRVLIIKTEALNVTLTHSKMAEIEFSNGSIPLSELSRVNEIYNKARVDLEIALNDFKNTYNQLELLSGMDFNTSN